MVNSTFPLDFIITVNTKKEILLFHKDMQQTLRRLSSREAPLVYLNNFNDQFYQIAPIMFLSFWHNVLLLDCLCDGGRNQSKRYAGIPQWTYSLTETNLCRGCISLLYYITSKCFDHLLINTVSFFGVLSFVVT